MWKPAHRKRGYSSGYHASFIEEDILAWRPMKASCFLGFLFNLFILDLDHLFFLPYGFYKSG